MPSAKCLPSVHRHCRIDLLCPAVDASTQRLRFFETLLPQPRGHVHRAHAMMANHHNVFFGVEFLIEARRNIAHGNQFAVCNLRNLEFPGLADVKQHELSARLLPSFQFFGCDFVIQNQDSSMYSTNGSSLTVQSSATKLTPDPCN